MSDRAASVLVVEDQPEIRHPHCVPTHRQLLQAVWGPHHAQDTPYLRVYMGQLRRKGERDPAQPRHLLTETGIGYRFVP